MLATERFNPAKVLNDLSVLLLPLSQLGPLTRNFLKPTIRDWLFLILITIGISIVLGGFSVFIFIRLFLVLGLFFIGFFFLNLLILGLVEFIF